MKTNTELDNLLWLVVDPLSGHRSAWAIELGILAKKMEIPLGVVAVGEPVLESSKKFEKNAKTYFFSTIFVENELKLRDFLLAARKQQSETVFLFLDLEKHVFWLLKNRINFKGIFMRPYLEGFNIHSILIWIIKRIITTLSLLIPNANIRLLAIPFQRTHKLKKAWVRDELTLNRIMSDCYTHEPECVSRYKNAIVVPGYLDTRKGLDLAIMCVKRLRVLTGESLKLLFIGKATSNFLDTFSKVQEDYISLEDGFLSDREYMNLLFSSRIILLPYSNRGASGIVIEALVLGTPVVIVGRSTWQNISKLSYGLVQFSRSNPKSISRAILRAETKRGVRIGEVLKEEELSGISKFFLSH